MAVHTHLLNFPFSSTARINSDEIFDMIRSTLEARPQFGPDSLDNFLICPDLAILHGPRSALVSVKVYRAEFVVTVNLEYYLHEGEIPLLAYQDCKELELQWATTLNTKKISATLPRILRGMPIDIYFPTTDERIVEYDIDQMVYDATSAFQHIQVAHSNTHGNMLILDGDPNMAESDLIYTEALMGRGVEEYVDKEILILGGGDGGLLCELLKEKPKYVTMIEIDAMVIDACKTHLRSVCGTIMDNLVGPKYTIAVADCLPYLETLKKENATFDYVFSDLTTIPVSANSTGEKSLLEFQTTVTKLACSVLKPGGKLMAHGPGSYGYNPCALFQDILRKSVGPQFKFRLRKKTKFVQSFMETWAFYEVELQSADAGQCANIN